MLFYDFNNHQHEAGEKSLKSPKKGNPIIPAYGGLRDRIPTRDGTANFISPARIAGLGGDANPTSAAYSRSRHRHARQVSNKNKMDEDIQWAG